MNIDHLSIYEKGLMASQPFVLQHSGPKSPFLIKLRSVFSVRSIEHLASWLPEGKIWRIHKIESFINAILPIFVEVSGWETFLLTLASHGFKEVSRGFDSVAFYSETFTRDECYPVSHCGTSPRKIGCQPLQPGPIFSCHRTIHDNVNLHGAAKVLALQLGTKQQHFDASKISQGLNLVDLLRLEHRTNGVREDAQDGLGTKRKTTEEFFSTSSTSSSSSSSSSFTSSFSEPATRKKPKKKWLPPLGPPEAESAAILGKRQAGGVWGHTSAEAFSTLSTLHRL